MSFERDFKLTRATQKGLEFLAVPIFFGTWFVIAREGFPSGDTFLRVLYTCGGFLAAVLTAVTFILLAALLTKILDGLVHVWPLTLLLCAAIVTSVFWPEQFARIRHAFENVAPQELPHSAGTNGADQPRPAMAQRAASNPAGQAVQRQNGSVDANVAISDPCPVMEVQSLLQEYGFFSGETDGVWGPKTRQALDDFQVFQELPRTGRVDASTCDNLRRGVATRF